MNRRRLLFASDLALLCVSASNAQYPVMEMVANNVVQKYQSSSCEELWQQKVTKKQPAQQEQKGIRLLHDDPQMRAAFFNTVSVPSPPKCSNAGDRVVPTP